MKSTRWLLGAAVLLVSLVLVPWAAMAASPPVIDGVFVGRAADGEGRVLLVFGERLTRVTAFELRTAADTMIKGLPIAHRTASLAVLPLPPDQPAGEYILAWWDRTSVGTATVRIGVDPVAPGSVTASSLAVDLALGLSDAESVGGESLPRLHDAARLTGTVNAARFSAFDDLVDESRVGTSHLQVAAGDHDHDARYPLRSELVHDHDTRYPLRTELTSSGTLNAAGNPVDWTKLKGVPSSVATPPSYTAGTGLTLSGGVFSVNFAGTGTAVTAARSNHTHAPSAPDLSGGGTITGKLNINASGQALAVTSGTTGWLPGGIDCTAANGTAIAGHGDVGVIGDLDSGGHYGVWGHCTYPDQVGVYGSAESNQSIGVYGAAYLGAGVQGRSYAGTGVYGFTLSGGTGVYYGTYYPSGAVGVKAVSRGGYSTALSAEARGASSTALLVNHTGGSGDLAVFQADGTNCARIALDGTGYFNGGTYSSGADFAESVAVDAPAAEFEPGDVIAIDPASPRRFSLCRTPDSPLVAGVVSTRPAVVGSTHDVARDGRAALAGEVRIGIVGIVPTKVCDEGGAIVIGDLLVSASRPGRAKKAPERPAPGTVIGKALGALAKGTGEIEVLLTQR